MVQERIIAWHQNATKNGGLVGIASLPASILFYRDGVSESQYGMVYLEELPKIMDGCSAALASLKLNNKTGITSNAEWRPKLTLIVVTKRHHTRFYPRNEVKLSGDE